MFFLPVSHLFGLASRPPERPRERTASAGEGVEEGTRKVSFNNPLVAPSLLLLLFSISAPGEQTSELIVGYLSGKARESDFDGVRVCGGTGAPGDGHHMILSRPEGLPVVVPGILLSCWERQTRGAEGTVVVRCVQARTTAGARAAQLLETVLTEIDSSCIYSLSDPLLTSLFGKTKREAEKHKNLHKNKIHAQKAESREGLVP